MASFSKCDYLACELILQWDADDKWWLVVFSTKHLHQSFCSKLCRWRLILCTANVNFLHDQASWGCAIWCSAWLCIIGAVQRLYITIVAYCIKSSRLGCPIFPLEGDLRLVVNFVPKILYVSVPYLKWNPHLKGKRWFHRFSSRAFRTSSGGCHFAVASPIAPFCLCHSHCQLLLGVLPWNR